MGNNQVKGANLHDNLVVQGGKNRKVEDHYNVVEQALATGSSTQIKQGTSKKYTKSNRSANDGVAIKLYDGKAEIPPDLKQEASILSQCDHPNIVKLYETTKVNKRLSLVLELCTGGGLKDRMPYEEKRAAVIIRQVTSAISYLHQKNIVHRDIELDNILFETKDEHSDIKLIDFGCATELELVPGHAGAFKFLKEKTGHIQTMAPEVVRGKYGPKCDVWSIGITAKMLLQNGDAPFQGKTVEEMERKILQGTLSFAGWKHSSTAKDFIQSTAMVNAGMRLSSSSALAHPWMESAKDHHRNSSKLGKSTDLIPNELVMSVELYRMAQPLKRIGLNALARKMTNKSKYRQLFLDLDTTHSGTLTKDEFLEGFKHTGNDAAELDDLFQKLDINCNGVIMFTEFLAATLEAEGELEDSQLQEAFDMIDTDHSGYITKKDLTKMLGSDPKVKESIQIMLKGKDKVSFDDFAELFEHGFGSGRAIDPIAEMSLNEEQLSRLKPDEKEEHMASIRESMDF